MKNVYNKNICYEGLHVIEPQPPGGFAELNH